MNKKIAIPVNNNVLSEFFGMCNHYEVFSLHGGKIERYKLRLPDRILSPEIPSWIAKEGITDLITFKIDKQMLPLFARHKIDLYVGVNIESPEMIIKAYMEGTLVSDKKIIEELNTN